MKTNPQKKEVGGGGGEEGGLCCVSNRSRIALNVQNELNRFLGHLFLFDFNDICRDDGRDNELPLD